MSPELQWIASAPASLAHAAAMLALGHALIDAELATRLAPIVSRFDAELAGVNVDRRQFWAHLVPRSTGLALPLACDIDQRLLETLAHCGYGNTAEELALRAGPLRDAWEARGPGFWRALHRYLREVLALPAASVLLVQPALGGGGMAFFNERAISFEAVLANPLRELPEVVRLGWLLAQITPAMHHRPPLALVATVLAAAEEVELARCDVPTCSAALTAWRLAAAADSRPLAEQILATWRELH